MPVITISRMYGAGGGVIASDVAHALGWTLLDRQFVDEVAARLGTTRAAVEAIEERVPSLVERIADTLAFSAPEVTPTTFTGSLPPSDEQVLDVTCRIIDDAVARGPAVVVGHGAQCYLRAREDALHVMCCAPVEALVTRVMARESASRSDAEQIVRTKNQQRADYVMRFFEREWLLPSNYHLCLNTEWFGLEGATAIILRVARERFQLMG